MYNIYEIYTDISNMTKEMYFNFSNISVLKKHV